MTDNRAVSRNKAYDQWYTEPWLARWLVDWAQLTLSDVVLEPCAGDGAIVRAVPESIPVIACEIDDRMLPTLSTAHPKLAVFIGDFFDPRRQEAIAAFKPTVAIENPAFSKPRRGIDSEFVQASLKLTSRVVALIHSDVFYGKTRRQRIWDHAVLTRVCFLEDRPRFDDGSGQGGMTNFVVIDIRTKRFQDEVSDGVVARWVNLEELREAYSA